MNRHNHIGMIQYLIVVSYLIITVIDPVDRFIWLLEVSWILAGLAILIPLNLKGLKPTPLLGWALVLHSVILIYGAWYTYAKVPLGNWVSAQMGWERNHYDRLGHFVQGFFPAILIREILYRNRIVNGVYWLELIVFAFLMAFTAIFEIIEFAAAMAYGDGAIAYLGSQGDVWDAQWDMVMCGIGGIISICLLSTWHRKMMTRVESHRRPAD